MLKRASNWKNEFFITDHLGNTRVTFENVGGALRAKDFTDYDPTSIELLGINQSVTTENRFKVQGKESLANFGLGGIRDFGARLSDATIGGIWNGVDANSDSREWLTPFNYCQNNSLIRIDPDGNFDDYLIRKDGDIIVKKTDDSFDRFYTETSQTKKGNIIIRSYSLEAKLEKNDAGLVAFPDNGNGYTSYGASETGGESSGTKNGKSFTESVGSGDNYVKPETAARLFGVTNELRGQGITISFGDMSSSNGSDPANGGSNSFHHGGHGHLGKRSGLDSDFRYIGVDGNSYQGVMSNVKFDKTNNTAVYDAAKTFGSSYKNTYQGTTGSISGVKTMGGHNNNHGHLGFNKTSSNFKPYKPYTKQ